MGSRYLSLKNNPKDGQKPKSISLQDLTDLSSSFFKTTKVDGVSCDTLNSHSLASTTKSKDSGIHRSLSCLSLTSSNRNYSHVESKVKAYIQNIKSAEAQRKKSLKSISRSSPETPLTTSVLKNVEEPTKLIRKISELEFELREKSILLDTQQEQYNALLYKYAEAKNTIDSMRFRSSSVFNNSSLNDFNPSLSNTIDNIQTPKVNQSATQGKPILNDMSVLRHSTPLTSPKQIRNELGPVCSIFSTSSRLNKKYVSLSVNLPKEGSFERVKKWQQSLPSIDLLGTCSSHSDNLHRKQRNSKQAKEVDTAALIKVQNNKSMLGKLCQTKSIESYNNNKTHKGKYRISQSRKNNYSKSLKKLVQNKKALFCSEQNSPTMLKNDENIDKKYLFTEYRDANQNKPPMCESSDEDSSSDDESSYLPSSTSSSVSKNLHTAHLLSDDSSSIASSVLDSMTEFYNFIQKKSPKRKVNLNSYSPCKGTKLKEDTLKSEYEGRANLCTSGSSFSSQLLKESRLNHLFPDNAHKLTKKFQSKDSSNEVWWKRISQTELKKSENLEECLNNAEYFVMILSDGLKKVESTLYKPPKIV